MPARRSKRSGRKNRSSNRSYRKRRTYRSTVEEGALLERVAPSANNIQRPPETQEDVDMESENDFYERNFSETILHNIRNDIYSDELLLIKRGLMKLPSSLNAHKDELMARNVLPSAAMIKLWDYMDKKRYVFLLSPPENQWLLAFQEHNRQLKSSSLPDIRLLQTRVASRAEQNSQHMFKINIQNMLKDGCIDDDETFHKWLSFVINAESGRHADSHDFFESMLRNVDILLNDNWYKTVLAARVSTLRDFYDIDKDKERDLKSRRAHDRLLKWLTLGEYEKAYRFILKLRGHDINNKAHPRSLELDTLYTLLSDVYLEMKENRKRKR